jgi:hypothetical protein
MGPTEKARREGACSFGHATRTNGQVPPGKPPQPLSLPDGRAAEGKKVIYKRACNKKGSNGSCSKCGECGSCGVYWYKFMCQGKFIRESSHQGNDKIARQMESAHRTSLAKGEIGICEKKTVPTLTEFIKGLSKVVSNRGQSPSSLQSLRRGSGTAMECDA